jgi:hypothetical protein
MSDPNIVPTPQTITIAQHIAYIMFEPISILNTPYLHNISPPQRLTSYISRRWRRKNYPPYSQIYVLTIWTTEFWSRSPLYFHLQSKYWLNKSRVLIPNPPLFYGRQMVSQFTQQILFNYEFLPRKNLCWILTNFFKTHVGALKKEK